MWLERPPPSRLLVFWDLISCHVLIWFHQKIRLLNIWNYNSIWLVIYLLLCIFAILSSKHIGNLWILHLIFSGTCHMSMLLQMVVLCICIFQTNMQIKSGVINAHLVSGYDIWQLASKRDEPLALVSSGNISLKVEPLWTCHISAWLSFLNLSIIWLFDLPLVLVWNLTPFSCFIRA